MAMRFFVDRDVTVRADRIDFFRRENRDCGGGWGAGRSAGFSAGLSSRLEYGCGQGRGHSHSGPFRAGVPPLFVEGLSFEGTREEIDFSEVSLHFQEPRSLFTGCASTVSACSTGGEIFL